MIVHSMIGDDEDLAREVLIVGRDIAPCISSFAAQSEEAKDALAILRRVYKDISKRSAGVKAQRIGPASVEYKVEQAFDGQPRRALLALCAAGAQRGHSLGSFPADRPIARIWPEKS